MSDKDQINEINEVNEWMLSALKKVMNGCQAIANDFAIISDTGMTGVTVMVMDSHIGDDIKRYLEEKYRVNDGQPE